MDQPLHPFDQAIQLTRKNNQFHGETTAAYANMIGPFGGITAAVMLQSLLQHPERLGDPIALTVNFPAAVKDGPFEIETKLIRTGGSTQHWFVSLISGGEIATTATAIFAKRKKTWGTTDLSFPNLSSEAKLVNSDMMPPWAKNYQFRMDEKLGNLITEKQTGSQTLQTIQDQPPRPLDFASLTAMADVFPPRVFIRRKKFVPIGTVTFSVYFHITAATLADHGDSEVIGHARANRFFDRYHDQTGEIWSLSGELLATTSQMVYYKE